MYLLYQGKAKHANRVTETEAESNTDTDSDWDRATDTYAETHTDTDTHTQTSKLTNKHSGRTKANVDSSNGTCAATVFPFRRVGCWDKPSSLTSWLQNR